MEANRRQVTASRRAEATYDKERGSTVESEPDALFASLANVADLEDFLHELHERLGDRELKHGDDLTARASDLGVRVPEFLAGEPLVYQVHDHKEQGIEGRALVLVRPSGITDPVAERKIYCGRWKRYTICLECGWIWCKIVIYGRF
jgi:hypothetical protein